MSKLNENLPNIKTANHHYILHKSGRFVVQTNSYKRRTVGLTQHFIGDLYHEDLL
jgi:hypothetical protein